MAFSHALMAKLTAAIAILGLTVCIHGYAVTYKSADCEDSGFVYGPWQELSRKEPKIAEFLGEIAHATGQTGTYVYVTNCVVKWPVDTEDKPVSGNRTVVIDKIWKTEGVTQHAGMKIIWDVVKSDETHHADGSISIFRTRYVRGFAMCRTPATCQELAIPFRAGLKEQALPH